MDTNVIFIIVLVAMIAVVATAIAVQIKRRKASIQQDKQNVNKLSNTLAATGQHLKYKKLIDIQVLLFLACGICLIISVILLYFLPLFQIKTEFSTKSFSIYDNFTALKGEENEKMRYYTDVDPSIQSMAFVFSVLALIWFIVDVAFTLYPFNSTKRAERFFINVKAKRVPKGLFYNLTTWQFYALTIVVQLVMIFVFKNQKYNFSSNIPFTTSNVGNYIVYTSTSGDFLIRVYQNNFKFCNAVSPQIAIPIVLLVLAVILFIIATILKVKIKDRILKEELPAIEEKTQTQTN